MQQSIRILEVALRVLSALNEKRYPDNADVAILEEFAGPKPSSQDLDEFTCDVIRKALSHRSEVRKALGPPRTFTASEPS